MKEQTQTKISPEARAWQAGELELVLYRSLTVMNARLSADNADLDRRLDAIMAAIASEDQPRRSFKKARVIRVTRRTARALRRRFVPSVVKPGVTGAAAAAVGQAAKVTAGVADLVVTACVGAAVAVGVALVLNQPTLRVGRRRGASEP